MSFDLTILELSLRVTLPIAVASSLCTFQAKLEPVALILPIRQWRQYHIFDTLNFKRLCKV